jgi:dTDP-4-amino-4,6-dideoxygalactose transaminase
MYVLLADMNTRDGLLTHLREQGIHAVFHYVPLHSSPMGLKFGYSDGDLPLTEDLSGRLLRLPFYYEITEEEQAAVATAVTSFLRRNSLMEPSLSDTSDELRRNEACAVNETTHLEDALTQ